MRAFFSKDFMPAIHYSSFEAGTSQDEDDEDRVLHGFLAQTRNVLVGVRAAIERVMQEGWSMVLEGVHLVPGMVSADIEGALVVQFVLAIDDVEAHASHFWLRDSASGSARPFERYLDSLGDIREIQDYIVGRAEKAGVRATERAALAGARWLGRADQEGAERDSAEAMRSALEHLPIDGQVVIGAGGDEDETLGRGQRVGAGGEQVDLALDPLEGRGVVARGGGGAMSMIAVGEPGSLQTLP